MGIIYQSSLEILFPLGLPEELGFKGSVFTDLGNVFGLDKDAENIMNNNKIRASFGLVFFGILLWDQLALILLMLFQKRNI